MLAILKDNSIHNYIPIMKKIIFSILLLALLVISNSSYILAIEIPSVPEVSYGLCTDTVDNDQDGNADFADSDCTPFLPIPENTLAKCSDTLDNDQDGNIDLADADCSAYLPIPENTSLLCGDTNDNDLDGNIDLADSDCAPFLPTESVSTSTENTLSLCSDTNDNDLDGNIDLADSDCAPFLPVAENSALLCADTNDNDLDGNIDLADSDCAPFLPTTPATTTENTPVVNAGGAGGFSGSSFGSGSGFSSVPSAGTPVSAVATSSINDGIDMNCSQLFTTYMHIGRKNNVAEVTRLQAFLNRNLGTKINPTGFFGESTLSAVKLFQLKYSDTVLKPWVDAGLSTDLTTNPSGYVYKTTQRQINLLVCPLKDIPMPVLK